MENPQWFEELQKSARAIGAQIALIHLVMDMRFAGKMENFVSVAEQYDLPFKVVERVVLINFPLGRDEIYSNVLEWGLSNGLSKSTVHILPAIAEQMPCLNYQIGTQYIPPAPISCYLGVVETTGCTINGKASAGSLYFCDDERRFVISGLNSFDNRGTGIDDDA